MAIGPAFVSTCGIQQRQLPMGVLDVPQQPLFRFTCLFRWKTGEAKSDLQSVSIAYPRQSVRGSVANEVI